MPNLPNSYWVQHYKESVYNFSLCKPTIERLLIGTVEVATTNIESYIHKKVVQRIRFITKENGTKYHYNKINLCDFINIDFSGFMKFDQWRSSFLTVDHSAEQLFAEAIKKTGNTLFTYLRNAVLVRTIRDICPTRLDLASIWQSTPATVRKLLKPVRKFYGNHFHPGVRFLLDLRNLPLSPDEADFRNKFFAREVPRRIFADWIEERNLFPELIPALRL